MKFKIYNEEIELDLSPIALTHFADPNNYSGTIIRQMSEDRMYDDMLQSLINKGHTGTALDIGANIGLFTLYIKNVFSKIYSIEPDKKHFQILQELTSKFTHIIPKNIAISNKTGMQDFFISGTNTTTNALFHFAGYSPIKSEIQGYTLKDFLWGMPEGIDFIKMDIEGAETFVIMDDSFNQQVADFIKNIYIETHNTCNLPGISDAYGNAHALCQKLNSLGYKTSILPSGDALFATRNLKDEM